MKHYIAIVAMSLFKIQKSSWKLITNNNDLSESSLEKFIQSCSTNKCLEEFQEVKRLLTNFVGWVSSYHSQFCNRTNGWNCFPSKPICIHTRNIRENFQFWCEMRKCYRGPIFFFNTAAIVSYLNFTQTVFFL